MTTWYEDSFTGTAGALGGRGPDTTGVNAWQNETTAGKFKIDGAGNAYANSADQDLILTGDTASNEYHESIIEFVFGGTATGRQIGIGARHSGTGTKFDPSRNGYLAWVNDSGYAELRKITAGAWSSNVGGFPGGGTTQLTISNPTTDNVKLKLITRNNGSNVELEYWYNINNAGWSRVSDGAHPDGIYTDTAPGAAFTAAGLDAMMISDFAGTSTADVLWMQSNDFASGNQAPSVTAFTVADETLIDSTTFQISSFTGSDPDGSISGYAITTTASPPGSSQSGTPITSYNTGGFGSFTLYPWVFDNNGQVSGVYGSPVSVLAVDSTAGATILLGTGFSGGITA